MQQKTFTKYLFAVLFLLQLPMATHADDKYRPVAVWPFIYEDFTDARILVGPTNKVVKAKANIHLRNTTLWFISGRDNKTKLEAQPGTINQVSYNRYHYRNRKSISTQQCLLGQELSSRIRNLEIHC